MKWSPESMTLLNWKLGRTGAARGEEKRWSEMESDQHTPGTGKQAVSRMRGYSLHPQRSVGEDWRSRVAEQSRISVYRLALGLAGRLGPAKTAVQLDLEAIWTLTPLPRGWREGLLFPSLCPSTDWTRPTHSQRVIIFTISSDLSINLI